MDFDKILDILRENSQAKRFKEINSKYKKIEFFIVCKQ